mgnify:CR=1 FL=1
MRRQLKEFKTISKKLKIIVVSTAAILALVAVAGYKTYDYMEHNP